MNESIPVAKLVALASCVLIGGFALTLPLFSFRIAGLLHSRLFLKIMWWIPIFLAFIVYLFAGEPWRLIILLLLQVAALKEVRRYGKIKSWATTLLFWWYVVGFSHLYLLGFLTPASNAVGALIAVCFSSVLSDVGAFFCGNYIGKHKLPAWLNPSKSWEGVAGQIGGALVGVVLLRLFVLPALPVWVVIPIGLGSAVGDLLNSLAKRKQAIKEWGTAIPGHGGYLDRFSSLAGSALLSFYALFIFWR